MAKPLRLRRFLYLDESLTNDFLAQIEGGIYEEEAHTTTHGNERKRGADASVGPVTAGLSGARSAQEVTSRTVKQVAEGAFTRLATALEEQDAVQWLDAFDASIWNQLRRGEVLELEATLSLPTVFQFMAMADTVKPLLELMKATGETVDSETEHGLEMLAAARQLFKDPVVLARPSGTPSYTFIVPLEAQWIRGELGGLTGEMTVIGTLERKLRDSDQWSLLDSIGLAGLPNSKELTESLTAASDLEGSVVKPPAATLKPLAIYR